MMYYLLSVCVFRQAFGSEVAKLYNKPTETHSLELVISRLYRSNILFPLIFPFCKKIKVKKRVGKKIKFIGYRVRLLFTMCFPTLKTGTSNNMKIGGKVDYRGATASTNTCSSKLYFVKTQQTLSHFDFFLIKLITTIPINVLYSYELLSLNNWT